MLEEIDWSTRKIKVSLPQRLSNRAKLVRFSHYSKFFPVAIVYIFGLVVWVEILLVCMNLLFFTSVLLCDLSHRNRKGSVKTRTFEPTNESADCWYATHSYIFIIRVKLTKHIKSILIGWEETNYLCLSFNKYLGISPLTTISLGF